MTFEHFECYVQYHSPHLHCRRMGQGSLKAKVLTRGIEQLSCREQLSRQDVSEKREIRAGVIKIYKP